MGERVAFFDCFAGVSGDMLLGALVDLVGEEAFSYLEEVLRELSLPGVNLKVVPVFRQGIRAMKVEITTASPQLPRRWQEIREMLSGAGLSTRVKEASLRVFQRLAEVEGKIHGCSPDEVHFHEVGAWDSLVDVVGVMTLLEALAVEEIYASSLPVGEGWVETQHGWLPLPAPATLELLRGCPLHGGFTGETVTPTGAALLTTLVRDYVLPMDFILERMGYGAGEREKAITKDGREMPNLLRVWLGRLSTYPASREVNGAKVTADNGLWVVEANLDDMSPEWSGYLADRLREEGAVEVYFTPVIMKKGRPGFLITALVPAPYLEVCTSVLFRESTTTGLRFYPVQRKVLPRGIKEVIVDGEKVRVKVVSEEGRLRVKPEYEDCRRLAEKWCQPLPEIYQRVDEEVRVWLKNERQGSE